MFEVFDAKKPGTPQSDVITKDELASSQISAEHLAHIDHDVVNVNDFKMADIKRALKFRRKLLANVERDKPNTLYPYKSFFYACLLLKHINENGLSDYYAMGVKLFFTKQASKYGLDKQILSQYFMLSPLVLDAQDYLLLKESEDATWLINNRMKAVENVPALSILLPFDKVEELIELLGKTDHELASFLLTVKHSPISNAWAYEPTKSQIPPNTLNIVLTYDLTATSTPILTLLLKKCSMLLQLDKYHAVKNRTTLNNSQPANNQFEQVKRAIDSTQVLPNEPTERLVLGNTHDVSDKNASQEANGKIKVKRSPLKSMNQMLARLLATGKKADDEAQQSNNQVIIQQPKATIDSTQQKIQTPANKLANDENKNAHLLWQMGDMGIFVYIKEPMSL